MTSRPRHLMPDDVREAMEERGVLPDYEARPAFQRNDYIGWIERARTPETRWRRIEQMLEELERGGIYMKMAHAPSLKPDA